MNLNEMATQAYEIALRRGFYKNTNTSRELALLSSELYELLEAYEMNNKASYLYNAFDKKTYEMYIKDTIEDELADVFIQTLSLMRRASINSNNFDSLYEKHSKYICKKFNGFYDFFWHLIYEMQPYRLSRENANYIYILIYCNLWSNQIGIDLERCVELKMEYNSVRGTYD